MKELRFTLLSVALASLGLFRPTDGGASFAPYGTGISANINKLTLDSRDDRTGGTNSIVVPMPIPNTPQFTGATTVSQVLVLDSSVGVGLSNRLRTTLLP